LFADQIVVAVGNWLYWIIISNLTTTYNVGNATTVFGLVLLATTVTQLGFEYPLLRRVSTEKKVFATTFVAEVAITVLAMPIVFLVIYGLYDQSLHEFVWIAVTMLFLSTMSFVARFTLLGMNNSRYVLVVDVLATALRFASGYILVLGGLGAFGILVSYLLYFVLLTFSTFPIIFKKVGFVLGSVVYLKDITHNAVANVLAKFGRIFLFSLSVVMLASFGIDSSDIGVFYIALMMSIVAGSLAASMAYMNLPSSAQSGTDLSLQTIRLGLGLTSPIIAILISSPTYILSLIGPEYTEGSDILLILAVGTLPSSLVMIMISKFNSANDLRTLTLVGVLQVSIYAILFVLLVPPYGTFGCSVAIVSGFIASAVASLTSSDRRIIRYIINSVIAILIGVSVGYIAQYLLEWHPFLVLLTAFTLTSIAIIAFKNTSLEELKYLVNSVIRRDMVEQNSQSKYLLIGNYGNFNIGDEILLKQIIREKRKSSEKFYVLTRNPEFVNIYHSELGRFLIPIDVKELFLVLQVLAKCNRLIIGGGGMWSRYTGSLVHLLPIIIIFGKMIGKKIEFISVGIYSTSSLIDRIFVNLAILVSDSCSVRDDESFFTLWNINRKKAFKVEDLSLPYIRYMKREGLDRFPQVKENSILEFQRRQSRLIVGLSLKPFYNERDTNKLIEEFSKGINMINARYKDSIYFVLFPFSLHKREIENDLKLAERILAGLSYKKNFIVVQHVDPRAWFSAICEQVDIFIGMRYHSIIFASQAKKPILCIPYENKVLQYIKSNNSKSSNNDNNAEISAIVLEKLSANIIFEFVGRYTR